MAEEDLIFGKNRHFFGGIAPSNMQAFSVALENRKPKITATLPNDTVIDGQTLCTVAGAVIRRKPTDYPKDEFDGEAFGVITESGTVIDEGALPNGTYFYAAFPFTDQGVYNRNPANRAVVNPPKPMVSFTGDYNYDPKTGKMWVDLDMKLPEGVAGAVIRKSLNVYPKNEEDGTAVTTIHGNAKYTDREVEKGKTYYYAAFPFTSTGAYNRETTPNRAVVNGTTPPSAMKQFSAYSDYDVSKDELAIAIDYKIPADADGVIVRKSTSGYPVDELDGSEVFAATTDGSFRDLGVRENTTYYYAAFPYNGQGAYNREVKNRQSVLAQKMEYFYGYDIKLSDENPTTRVSYPSDVMNHLFAPVKMNFGGNFSFGGWPHVPGKGFMPRPCMLRYDGTVAYYLDPNDYTKKADGSPSDVANTGFAGNAMMEWPKIYTKRWEEGGVYHFRCSDMKIDAGYECWSNYDRQDHEIDHFYTPIYFGSYSGDKLRSISGQSNMVSQNADTEISRARANGADWYTEVIADRMLINDLLFMMGRSTDGQTVYGKGRVNESSAASTGTMNQRGLFWGSNNGTDGVKVFGMEHHWGNIRRRTAGWILHNQKHKVKMTRGTHDGTSVSDYNTNGNGYRTISSGNVPTSGGYISQTVTTPYGRFPIAFSGSSSTFECDSAYPGSSGPYYPYLGGDWGHGLYAGPSYANLSASPSYTASYIGAALSCKPLAAA